MTATSGREAQAIADDIGEPSAHEVSTQPERWSVKGLEALPSFTARRLEELEPLGGEA